MIISAKNQIINPNNDHLLAKIVQKSAGKCLKFLIKIDMNGQKSFLIIFDRKLHFSNFWNFILKSFSPKNAHEIPRKQI